MLRHILLVSGVAVATLIGGTMLIASAGAQHQAEPEPAAGPATTQPSTRPSDSYPLNICPVSGEKLGGMGQPIVAMIDGRTVKLCCAGCESAFKKDAERYHAKMDELIIKAQAETYPLDTCLVSGGELGGMGEVINHVHRGTNQLVRFCCEGCIGAFEANPEKYLGKIKAAEAEQAD